MQKRWDIFCHVVDNYGDAGVCWRLAHQLAAEFGLCVRLWIDDLTVLKKFCPELELSRDEQMHAGVRVCRWSASLLASVSAADVVIEAFACEPPLAYRAAMATHRSLWINLEYLSAERWVSGCHGLPSPQADSALKKYFFFPGFRADTGGVLGECDLSERRRAFQQQPAERAQFLRRFGIDVPEDPLCVSLFSYRSAPIALWLLACVEGCAPLCCLVPEGQPLVAVEHFFGEPLRAGDIRTRGALTVAVLPFLSQADYDRLLWSCDLNFVRGEDSFVRAQWAARPFVWQIYAQADDAHWPKLDAFLELYCEQLPAASASALHAFWRSWNGRGDIVSAWRSYPEALPALRIAAQAWAARLEAGTNLAAALVQFCANQV